MSINPLNILLNHHYSTNKLAEEHPKIFRIIKKIKKGEPVSRNEENYLWMIVPYFPVIILTIGIIVMFLIQNIYK